MTLNKVFTSSLIKFQIFQKEHHVYYLTCKNLIKYFFKYRQKYPKKLLKSISEIQNNNFDSFVIKHLIFYKSYFLSQNMATKYAFLTYIFSFQNINICYQYM